jgi:hypothetical protein
MPPDRISRPAIPNEERNCHVDLIFDQLCHLQMSSRLHHRAVPRLFGQFRLLLLLVLRQFQVSSAYPPTVNFHYSRQRTGHLDSRHEGLCCSASVPSFFDPVLDQHPALTALALDLRPRSRLKPHHELLFQDDPNTTDNYDDADDDDDDNANRRLFNQLGRVCCRSGVVSRKEFFETYAAAVAIHHAEFAIASPPSSSMSSRIADMAAGHGLLAWFLLALDETGSRTVICVDRRMPQATERITTVMREAFGTQLTDRWTYVQADISACQPHSSCLLVSVHGCGSLTDDLIAMAIDARAPCAVVPCCHSIRPGAYRPHALAGLTIHQIADRVEEGKRKVAAADDGHDKHLVVADIVDEVRHQTLQRAGYRVKEVQLPEAFTARNRLLLATPLSTSCSIAADGSISSVPSRIASNSMNRPFLERQRPTTAKVNGNTMQQHSQLKISLANDPESIAHCREVSGKERSMERLMQQIPRHFSVTFALSIWLSDKGDNDGGGDSSSFRALLTLNDLQGLANIGCEDNEEYHPIGGLTCKVMKASATGGTDVSCNKEGRCSQLYKFQYTPGDGGNMSGEPRTRAKHLHGLLRDRIVAQYGNVLR